VNNLCGYPLTLSNLPRGVTPHLLYLLGGRFNVCAVYCLQHMYTNLCLKLVYLITFKCVKYIYLHMCIFLCISKLFLKLNVISEVEAYLKCSSFEMAYCLGLLTPILSMPHFREIHRCRIYLWGTGQEKVEHVVRSF
jgi:hypothetical protein